MRKKPGHSNNYNNRQRPRYTGGGHGGGHSHGGSGGGNRPRRNYGAAREKYLAQARDALACGDRVLAENFLQHAEHCYRMMVEEGSFRPQQPQRSDQPQDGNANVAPVEEFLPENTNALPAFLTGTYDRGEQKPVEPAAVQNWEERDA